MVIFPKDRPVIEQLKSFYVNINRLIEHYQGELVSGVFHFKSAISEGAVFFDKNSILEGIYTDKDVKLTGEDSVSRIIKGCEENNYTIGVYEIDPAKVIFWANMVSADRIYKDLSTEFTDLQGLMKKMSRERLTGYIEVIIAGLDEKACVLFSNGEIIGGLFSWEKDGIDESKQNLVRLIEDTKKSSGVFHVSKIALTSNTNSSSSVLEQLEQLLTNLAGKLKPAVKSDAEFELLLKKKLVDNAERFTFLDPFAGEFAFAGRKVSYNGDASDRELVTGVVTTAMQIAKDHGIMDAFKDEWIQFLHSHGGKIDGLN